MVQTNDLFLMLTRVPNLLVVLAVIGSVASPGHETGKRGLSHAR
jgi:hypothetical protein